MAEPDPAARKFWILQAARFGAVLMVFIGALIIGKILDLPEVVGYILLVIGAVEFFLVPRILMRNWQKNGQ
ncbi:hypothetical protein [Qipengyuania gelatinilytica]|uniref:Uncharacterized protein n=1 Tax=Qipengyuania gelatinilytica TaxID=2867231 RepID=A0ABX9A3J2_9SPHN|nr:hypothetical protein [Qipengyuania gelatinilytica]QZD94754.1 hypothetical protein K3136_11790 [Qipengyuania gelatinilytica]